jgi:hypothetical protein
VETWHFGSFILPSSVAVEGELQREAKGLLSGLSSVLALRIMGLLPFTVTRRFGFLILISFAVGRELLRGAAEDLQIDFSSPSTGLDSSNESVQVTLRMAGLSIARVFDKRWINSDHLLDGTVLVSPLVSMRNLMYLSSLSTADVSTTMEYCH